MPKKEPENKKPENSETKNEMQPDEGTEVAVDDETIDRAVEAINEIANKSVYSGMMEIGQYVLEKFFKNDIEKATSRNPHKPESFKKLCARDDLVVSLTSLSMAVRVAGQEKFLEEKKIETEKLTYTHKTELIKMDNDGKKIFLTKRCIDEKWSTRKLGTRLQRNLKASKRTRGLRATLISVIWKVWRSKSANTNL